jgi:sigma-E factor negative regulatory protein RseC
MSATCSEVAEVTGRTKDGRLTVLIRRAEACHSCQAVGACQALGGKTEDVVLVVDDNGTGAEPGDRVALAMAESSVIKASAVLYLLPALGLIGGAVVAGPLGASGGIGEDPAAIVGSALGLGLGLLVAKLVAARLSGTPEYTPRILSASLAPSGRRLHRLHPHRGADEPTLEENEKSPPEKSEGL